MTHVPFVRLLREEARALPRARFALAGAALLAGLLLVLGTLVATSMDGLWSFALVAYGILPAFLAGHCAAHVALLRTTRFGQALYTNPVRSGHVLAARLALGLGVAVAYVLATLPFLGVAALHLDVPAEVGRVALAGLGILLFCVAFGTMVGVLMQGRSVAGPAVVATGFVLLSFFAMTFAVGLFHPAGDADPTLLRALHVSPHLLLSDATGMWSGHVPVAAAAPHRALALFAVEVAACVAVAAVAYVRAQGPEGWECRRPARAALLALAVATLLLPTTADASYERIPGDQESRRGWSSETRNATVLLVPPGADAPAFGERFSGTRAHPLAAGEANARDLLILLHVPDGTALRDVRVTLAPGPRLDVDRAAFEVGDVPAAPRGSVDPEQMPTWRGGGAVLRVPVTLTPREPVDLRSNAYALAIEVEYLVEGEDAPGHASVLAALQAEVPWARAQMALAGAPAFLAAAVAAGLRRARVGGM